MKPENRIEWEENFEDPRVIEAYNKEDELLGNLVYEKVGAHMHWCWYQEKDIRMSPGCLAEVRSKQKYLLNRRNNKDIEEKFDYKKLKQAIAFAMKAHDGQTRKGTDKPYVCHPTQVCRILKTVKEDTDLMVAAMLHDTLEDTNVTYKQLKDEFGDRVARLVKEVTKDKQGNFHIKSRDAMLIKLADILHNLSDSNNIAYINKKFKWVIESVEKNQ